jgi:hypothetical protein
MNDLSFDALQPYFNKEAFVLKTQAQLSKDFAPFRLYFPESFNTQVHSITEIEEAIQAHLLLILGEGETRLLQLLYTIDISEKKFLELSQLNQFPKRLAEAILIREAMKVYLREKFA